MSHTNPQRERFLGLVVSGLLATACGGIERPDGWTEATHGKDASPAYELLFTTDRVHELRITLTAANHALMQEDLAALIGQIQEPRQPPPGSFTACETQAVGASCSFDDMGTLRSGVCEQGPHEQLVCRPTGVDAPTPEGPGLDKFATDPVYVPATVRHEGHVWTRVAMRYKGNASLESSYRDGIGKLSFRLHFDHFEDAYPEINNQRFYGFREITFSSNWGDDSMIRDCLAKELFRDRGVPAPRCAFYRVFVDVGGGDEYWGLYSAVEDPDDGAMLDDQFGGRGGNLYKPEGVGADFTHFDAAGFEKKTNADAADWSDVEGAIAALHADTTDAEAFRAGLEARFDAPRFITWLAVNTVIYNWDTYGRGPHNYYLYGDPARDGQLCFIPWDHNLAMMLGQPGRKPQGNLTSDPTTAVAEIFHTNVGANWPLISRLLADPVYADLYRVEVEGALTGLFAVEASSARIHALHDLIHPYVVGEQGERAGYTTLSAEAAFLNAVDGPGGLIEHVAYRHVRTRQALDLQ